MKYDNYYEAGKRDDLKTGDILLFSGRGPASRLIQIGTGSKWSHVGMVLRDDLDLIMSWESTMLVKQPSLDSGIIETGVMILNLSRRIAEYNGEIAVRPLYAPLNVGQIAKLIEMRKRVRKVPYEKNYIELIRSAYDGPFGANKEEDLSSIFCSELIAAYFKLIELLRRDKNSNEYTPRDFSSDEFNHIVGKIEYLKKEVA